MFKLKGKNITCLIEVKWNILCSLRSFFGWHAFIGFRGFFASYITFPIRFFILFCLKWCITPASEVQGQLFLIFFPFKKQMLLSLESVVKLVGTFWYRYRLLGVSTWQYCCFLEPFIIPASCNSPCLAVTYSDPDTPLSLLCRVKSCSCLLF